MGTSSETPDKNWCVFDGLIDTLWIGSVLDDNKICLSSDKIIKLTEVCVCVCVCVCVHVCVCVCV